MKSFPACSITITLPQADPVSPRTSNERQRESKAGGRRHLKTGIHNKGLHNTEAEAKHRMLRGWKVQLRQTYLVQRTTFSPVELTLLFLAHTVASVTRCCCCCSSSLWPREAGTPLSSTCPERCCPWKQRFAFAFDLLSVQPSSSGSEPQRSGDRQLRLFPGADFLQPCFASGFPSRGRGEPSSSCSPDSAACPRAAPESG